MSLHTCIPVCVAISLLVCGAFTQDPPPKWRHDDDISGKTLYCDWCKPGEYMNRPCTEHTPTECLPCPWEHYTEHYNQEIECLLCKQCNLEDHEHEHESLPCTSQQNRQCECDDGYYLWLEFCFPHTKCQTGMGVRERGTPWKNTRCMRCKSGTFSDEMSSTAECRAHTDCAARGECVARQGNRKRDNLCGTCAVNTTASKEMNTSFAKVVFFASMLMLDFLHLVTNSSVSDATQSPPLENNDNTTDHDDLNKSDDTTRVRPPHPGGSTWGTDWLPYFLIGLIILIIVVIVVVLFALWRHDPSVNRRRSSSRLSTTLTEIFTVKRSSLPKGTDAAGPTEPKQPLLEEDTNQPRRSSQEKAARVASHTTAAKRFQKGPTFSIDEEERIPSLTSDEELSSGRVTLSHVDHIAEDIGAKWRQLGRTLGFTDGQCDCFQNDYQGLREITYQMLRKWVEMKGEDATLGTLGNALDEVEKDDVRSQLFSFEHLRGQGREETS